MQTIDKIAVEETHYKAVKRLEQNPNFNGVVSTSVTLRPDKESFESYTITSGNGLFRIIHDVSIPTNIFELPTAHYI